MDYLRKNNFFKLLTVSISLFFVKPSQSFTINQHTHKPSLPTSTSTSTRTSASWRAFQPLNESPRSFLEMSATADDELTMTSFDDYKEQLEALSFLSGMSGDEDLIESAQEVFDQMYEAWMNDEYDDLGLEPDTDIYNLLLSIYANCGNMEVAEGIVSKMEGGQSDGVPEANEDTYLTLISSWGQLGEIEQVEGLLARLQGDGTDTDTDTDDEFPTTEMYNKLLHSIMKKGGRGASQKVEDILRQMIKNDVDDELDLPEANTGTFRSAMECYARNSGRGNSAFVSSKVEELVELMKSCKNDDCNHHHQQIVNEQIKVLSQWRKKGAEEEAEALLFGMLERYKKSGNEDERPNAASFIYVINVWGNVRSKTTKPAERASELLTILEDLYVTELEEGKDCNNAKGDARVYNAVMKIWARSGDKNKAKKTQRLLEKLQSLYDESEDEDYMPNIKSYNNVINAAAFTRGNAEEKQEAMRVMAETFKSIRTNELVEPDHITFGMFLKGSGNLISETKKRQIVMENIFRQACRQGAVSDFVIDSLFTSASSWFAEQMIGGKVEEDGIQIPAEWSRNVD